MTSDGHQEEKASKGFVQDALLQVRAEHDANLTAHGVQVSEVMETMNKHRAATEQKLKEILQRHKQGTEEQLRDMFQEHVETTHKADTANTVTEQRVRELLDEHTGTLSQ